MSTSSIAVTQGSGKNIATHAVLEDAVVKELQRVVPSTSDGVEIAPLTDTQLRASAVPVSAASLPLPTGAATAAKQLADNHNVVVTSAPTTAVTNAALTSLDSKVTACNTGAVVLAAGTAGIGKLTANSGVDIGDVDVTSLPAITGAVTANPSKLATTDDADFVRKYYTNAGAVTDGIIWSPAAGKRWYITDLIINTSAAAVVTIEDDLTAGDAPVLKLDLAANGGFVCNFKTPLASGEDAADLLITTTAGNIFVTAVGYEV